MHTTSRHIEADGSAEPGSEVSDWIPLRGTVTVRGAPSCAVVAPR